MSRLLSFAEARAALEKLGPVTGNARGWRKKLGRLRGTTLAAELAFGVEGVLGEFFLARHVPDQLQQAFALQYPDVAAEQNLVEFYADKLAIGPESAQGVVEGIRGKLFELRAEPALEELFPGFNFSLSSSATQPGWDLLGENSEGVEIFVQAKARVAEAASDVVRRMGDHGAPDFFVLTTELHDAIIGAHPELAERVLDFGLANATLNEEVTQGLATIAEQLNIEVPVGVTDVLPYVGELILAVRMIRDVLNNERLLEAMPRGDKTRLHAVRAISLMARFGVSTVITTASGAAGAAAGSVFPGAGTALGSLVGGVAGAIGAGHLNRGLEPRLLEFGLRFAGLTLDDLFYYQHKRAIDGVGEALLHQRLGLRAMSIG